MTRNVVELRHVSRSFGSVRALDDVSLDIRPGEVHALLGENGSGKSTLIKILNGYYEPDPGAEMVINGEPVELPLKPGSFRELGMSFVHQHLGLVDDLTVTENLIVGSMSTGRAVRRLSWSRARRDVVELLASVGVDVDPDAAVSTLSLTDRARLAIVRAIAEVRAVLSDEDHRGLLVLDEPTVFLPREGVDQLFALVREVVDRHASVLFVSHDLDEARLIADRVTVLRDGRVQGTVDIGAASNREIVEMIIGGKLLEFSGRETRATDAATAASVRNLAGGLIQDVSFDVRPAEILGVTGLLGSGFEEIPYLLFGALPARSGELVHGDRTHAVAEMTPLRSLSTGISLVPGDRQLDGAIGSLTVADNMMLPTMERYRSFGLLNRRGMRAGCAELLEAYDVRPPHPEALYQSLSGGNQQKALLAKWLQTDPSLILIHEPTQGVDIGARQQIFSLLERVVARGACIVCASSDYDQLATICDRVLVVDHGRIVREVAGEQLTKDHLIEQIYLGAAPMTTTTSTTAP